MFEVYLSYFGKPMIKRGPMAGCRGFETFKHIRIFRTRSLKKACELASKQTIRACVLKDAFDSTILFDNKLQPGSIDDYPTLT